MHIGIVCEYFPHIEKGVAERLAGGAETRAYYLSKYLSEKHKVTILATKFPLFPDTHREGNLTILRVGKPHVYTQFGKFYNRYFLIRDASKILAEIPDLDIIDCCTWFSYTVSLPKSVPSVITYHDVWTGRWFSFF